MVRTDGRVASFEITYLLNHMRQVQRKEKEESPGLLIFVSVSLTSLLLLLDKT